MLLVISRQLQASQPELIELAHKTVTACCCRITLKLRWPARRAQVQVKDCSPCRT